MRYFEQFLEKRLRKKLHKKRQHYIDEAIAQFIDECHPSPEKLAQFKKRLTEEANRVYTIVDYSLLRGGIRTANRTLCIGAICSAIIVGVLAAVTGGTALALIAPVLAAFVAWFSYVATIPYRYNLRVEAGLKTVIDGVKNDITDLKIDASAYKTEMNTTVNSLVNVIQQLTENQNLANSELHQEINNIQSTMLNMMQKVEGLEQKIEQLYQAQALPTNDFFKQEYQTHEELFVQQLTQLFVNSTHNRYRVPEGHIVQENNLYIAKLGLFAPVSTNPLLKAVETNQVYQLIALLKQQQNLQKISPLQSIQLYTTKDNYNLLHYAALFGATDVVHYLLGQGMDVEAKTNDGRTALDIAIQCGFRDVIVTLAQHSKPVCNDTYIQPQRAAKLAAH